jgi:hypothetical protein
MKKSMISEIDAFRNAILSGDYISARDIAIGATFISQAQRTAWIWEVEWKTEYKQNFLDDLIPLISKGGYELAHLYFYFELCLETKDFLRCEKMFDILSFENCDNDSPLYFHTIKKFLSGESCSLEEIRVARLLYNKNDREFIDFIAK